MAPEIRSREMARFRARYAHDPAAFVHDCIDWGDGGGPTPYQDEIMAEIHARRRGSVRSPHGTGKSAGCSWLTLHFALTRDGVQGADWKVPTTASVWRQLIRFLWPEIHKWARRLRWDHIPREPFDPRTELLAQTLKLDTGEAFAIASSNPAFIEGAHADSLLYLFDEAKTIIAATFDAAEGAFAAPDVSETLAAAISTPGAPHGRFYDIHSRKPGYEDWWTRHVTLEEAVAAGRISNDWVERRRKQWGENSATFQNRVLGEFAADEAVGIIPLSWLEMANERWHEWDDGGREGVVTSIGCDVGGGGQGDLSVVAVVYNHHIAGELRKFTVLDPDLATMELVGAVGGLLRKHPESQAYVDCIGIGTGVLNRLKEIERQQHQGRGRSRVHGFVAGEKTDLLDASGELGFANWRAAAWWLTREMCDPQYGIPVAIVPDNELTGDLTIPRYSTTSTSKYLIESKDSLRKSSRLGRSTDCGDAMVMALLGPLLVKERERGVPRSRIVYEPYTVGGARRI